MQRKREMGALFLKGEVIKELIEFLSNMEVIDNE